MNILEEYYNDRVKTEDSPAFNQLSTEEKEQLMNSLGLACFQAGKDMAEIFKGCRGKP